MFVDASIDSTPLQDWSFTNLVNTVIGRRARNPRFVLAKDFETVANEVDFQNAMRMRVIQGGSHYTIEDNSPLPVMPALYSSPNAAPSVSSPKVIMVYIYPLSGAGGHRDLALKFLESYRRHPPAAAHESLVVCNGALVDDDARELFKELPGLSFFEHDNSGWDIGAYQQCVKKFPCDLMMFMGSSIYFRITGWLARALEVYTQYGGCLYGAMGSQGDMRGRPVLPHIRTSGFWCPPKLLAEYPYEIIQNGPFGQRYEMEHGLTCFTSWVRQRNIQALVVGRSAIAPVEICDLMPEGFHRGSQLNLLMGDKLAAPPFWHTP